MKSKNEQQQGGGVQEGRANDVDAIIAEDIELLLREITDFCSVSSRKAEEIPETLENYMFYVSRSGNTIFPWQTIRPLFRLKMLAAIEQFAPEPCEDESFALERFDMFKAAPFTIQRFAELICDPNRHYKSKDKYLRGVEKTLLVVSTVEPRNLNEDGGLDGVQNGGFDGHEEPLERGPSSSSGDIEISSPVLPPIHSSVLTTFPDIHDSFAARAFVMDDCISPKIDILTSEPFNLDLQNFEHQQLLTAATTSEPSPSPGDTEITAAVQDTIKYIVDSVISSEQSVPLEESPPEPVEQP